MELVELTEYIVGQLLTDVDFKVEKTEEDRITIIKVLVPEESMPIVIGRGGKIANSIRTIIQALAYTKKLGRVRINIDSL